MQENRIKTHLLEICVPVWAASTTLIDQTIPQNRSTIKVTMSDKTDADAAAPAKEFDPVKIKGRDRLMFRTDGDFCSDVFLKNWFTVDK